MVEAARALALRGVTTATFDFPYVAEGRKDTVVGAEIALDRPCLGGRLDNDEVLRHRAGV